MRLVEGMATVEDVEAFVEALATIGETHGAVVQAFDARYITGRDHLEGAVRAARRARENDDAIADDPAVEVLLYAAGRRQIDRALSIGVSEGEGAVVVVVDGGDETAAASDIVALLEPASTLEDARDPVAIREFFGIGEEELTATDASLSALVVERVALLAVDK